MEIILRGVESLWQIQHLCDVCDPFLFFSVSSICSLVYEDSISFYAFCLLIQLNQVIVFKCFFIDFFIARLCAIASHV